MADASGLSRRNVHLAIIGHGAAMQTVLPSGWHKRLVRFETPGTNGVVAYCLEPHDLWVSKAIAGRPKDVEFYAGFRRDGNHRTRAHELRYADAATGARDRVTFAKPGTVSYESPTWSPDGRRFATAL